MWRYLKDCCYAFAARSIGRCIAPLPRRLALSLGTALATAVFWFSRCERNRAYRHLVSRLELDGPVVVKRLAQRCFQNMGKNVIEFMQLPHMSPRKIRQVVAFNGKANIDKALERGNGAIILTGHFGNWELLAASIVANGYPLSTIARQLRSKRLDGIVSAYREKSGYSSIDRDNAVRPALRCLKRNELLGIVADVDTRTDGVFVDFLGRPAYTPYSPVAIALKTGAAILPTFIVRQPDNSHHAIVEPPLDLKRSGDRERDYIYNTQNYTNVIESYVRRYPEQWIWMHERWRTQPQIGLDE